MPRSRKQVRNVSPNKRKRLERYKKLRNWAAEIKSQAVLDAVLLDESDPMERKAMFDYLKPHLQFAAEFPTRLHVPENRLIRI